MADFENAQVVRAEALGSLVMRAVKVLEAHKVHSELVTQLKRAMTNQPDAWAISWNDDDGPRRRAFVTKEQALGWLEDRRGSNAELAKAELRPLVAL